MSDHASGSELVVLDLPLFCLEHMRATIPEENLQMLKKFIQGRIGKNIQKVFIHSLEISGLTAEQIEPGIHLHVDTTQ